MPRKQSAQSQARIVLEGEPSIDRQDSGQALILEVGGGDDVFVRVQSWDFAREHEALTPFIAKRLRVTVEVVE